MKKSFLFTAILLICSGASAQSTNVVSFGDTQGNTLAGPVTDTGTGHAGMTNVPGLMGVGIKMFYETGSSISTAAQGNFKVKQMPNGSPYWPIGRVVLGPQSPEGYYENEVYFGDWVYTSAYIPPGVTWDRAQFYVGMQGTGTITRSDTVTYQVRGVSNYINGGGAQLTAFLSGNLTADFSNSSSKLSGVINNVDFSKAIQFTDVAINKVDGTFNSANGGSVYGLSTAGSGFGTTRGHFFGPNAEILAGLATFAGNAHLNTAFGGASNGAEFK